VVCAVRLLVPMRIARMEMRLSARRIWMLDRSLTLVESFIPSAFLSITLGAMLLWTTAAPPPIYYHVGQWPVHWS
jgi:hypothetical protein